MVDVYYISFPLDSYKRKSVVGAAYVLEILQVVLSTRDAFRVYSLGWGNPLTLDEVGFYWFSIPMLTGMSKWRFHRRYRRSCSNIPCA